MSSLVCAAILGKLAYHCHWAHVRAYTWESSVYWHGLSQMYARGAREATEVR